MGVGVHPRAKRKDGKLKNDAAKDLVHVDPRSKGDLAHPRLVMEQGRKRTEFGNRDKEAGTQVIIICAELVQIFSIV